jgi:hypothetical protein
LSIRCDVWHADNVEPDPELIHLHWDDKRQFWVLVTAETGDIDQPARVSVRILRLPLEKLQRTEAEVDKTAQAAKKKVNVTIHDRHRRGRSSAVTGSSQARTA